MARKAKNVPVVVQDESKSAGRPSKLTPETVKAITNAITMGSYVEVAYLLAGINPRTAEYWLQAGRADPDSEHARFLEQIKQALARSEIRDLSIIDSFAQGRPAEYVMVPMVRADGSLVLDLDEKPILTPALDGEGKPIIKRREIVPQWHAAAWKLERRAPKRWGRTDRILIDDMSRINEPPEESKSKDGETSADKVRTLLHKLSSIDDMGGL